MLKRTVSMVALSVFALTSLVGCGSTEIAPMLTDVPAVQSDTEVYSYTGVFKEIKNSSALAFKEIDKNADKVIAPDEYGVATADSAKAFYAIDDNHDGKITLKEFTPGFFSRVGLTFRLKSAADALFKQIDKSNDKFLTREELTSGLVSTVFTQLFDSYDKKSSTLLHKDQKGKLSMSEFEDLFAHIAMSNLKNSAGEPVPVPADPATPAPAAK